MGRRLLCLIALAITASPAQADDVIILANGDEMHGEILEWTDAAVRIEHPQLGVLEIPRDKLEQSQEKKTKPGLFGTSFLEGWNRSIDVGVTGKEGNTVNLNATAGFDFNKDDGFTRTLFKGRAFFNRDDEDGVTDNNASVDLQRDWLLPESRWFLRAKTRYEYDRFESWEHRLTFVTGPGYRLIDRERHELDIMAGPAFTREFGEREDSRGEAALGLDYRWQVTGRVSTRLSNAFFWDFTTGNNALRNITTGEIKMDITEDPKLNFKVGAENEWESITPDGDEPNDLQYYMALGVDF